MAREKRIDMVILGLLSHEDLTGYDMKKRIDGSIRFFWKGSFGNIYPALRDMETQGLIVKREASVTGREKITYSITQSGRKNLEKWLSDERSSNEIRYETLLKVFFGGQAKKEVSLHNIEVFEERIRADLALMKSYCEQLKNALDDEDHRYYYLTASFGVESYEAYLKWCKKAKEILG